MTVTTISHFHREDRITLGLESTSTKWPFNVLNSTRIFTCNIIQDPVTININKYRNDPIILLSTGSSRVSRFAAHFPRLQLTAVIARTARTKVLWSSETPKWTTWVYTPPGICSNAIVKRIIHVIALLTGPKDKCILTRSMFEPKHRNIRVITTVSPPERICFPRSNRKCGNSYTASR